MRSGDEIVMFRNCEFVSKARLLAQLMIEHVADIHL
jgi:hypothetical protein